MRTHNAADPIGVKEQSQKQKLDRKQVLYDVKFILSTAQGRRFYFRYLEACGVFKTSFTGTSETYFLEGQRNIGLMLLVDLNDADPESYLTMIRENKPPVVGGQDG